MKTLIAIVLMTVAAHSAMAAEATYTCKPYKNMTDYVKPEEAGLPATFSVHVDNSSEKAVFRIADDKQEYALTDFPFFNNVANAKRFDRYSAKGLTYVLIEKTAAQLPAYFTAKLEYDVDWFHDIQGWYGYACNIAQ